jgi:hypothetical protein
VKRGIAYNPASLDVGSGQLYSYAASTLNTAFFESRYVAPYWNVPVAQKNVQSKCNIETTYGISSERPIVPHVEAGIARIAVRVPNLSVESVSAIFTGYAREWNGTDWNDQPSPSRNAAAYYRDALLLKEHSVAPLPGEILDSFSLEEAFEFAAANGFTCDSIVQARSMPEVLQLLASSMRCSPRQSDYWGVVIDRDRTAETPSAMLTPFNSRNLGCEINYDKIDHGIRVTYIDADEDYAQREITVYRDGYNAFNATDVGVIDDRVSTTAALATQSAEYNLRQLIWRNMRYVYEVGMEGRAYGRGDLVAVADETWQRDVFYGLIKNVNISGGMIVSFDINQEAELSAAVDQITMAGDIDAVGDINAFSGSFGVMVRDSGGNVITAAINETSNTTRLTLTTPIADTGNFARDNLIAVGPLLREVKRMVLHAKENSGEETWTLSLLPEAPEIHA